MDAPRTCTVAAPRLTALLGLLVAVGVVFQGLFAGAFLHGDHQWYPWHQVLGAALVLPALVSVTASIALRHRERDSPSVLATRVALLVLVLAVLASGAAGLLAVHIPVAIAVAGIAVRQATGFVRVPNLGAGPRRHPTGAGRP